MNTTKETEMSAPQISFDLVRTATGRDTHTRVVFDGRRAASTDCGCRIVRTIRQNVEPSEATCNRCYSPAAAMIAEQEAVVGRNLDDF